MRTGVRAILVAAIVSLIILKFRLLPLVNINWDEFRYLSKVHEFDRGQLFTAFQTFHVRLFAWLPNVPGNEVDQVVAGRAAMFLLRLATSALVFLVGRRLFGTTGALIAVLASLGFSYLMRHGESFRSDPIIVFLFLGATALLVVGRPSRVAAGVAGVLLGATILVSAKAVFYLPIAAVIVAASIPGQREPGRLSRLALLGTAAILAYLALHWLHAVALPGGRLDSTGTMATQVAGRVLWQSPPLEILAASFRHDWAFWLLVLVGACFAMSEALWGAPTWRRVAWVVLGLLFPLSTLLFYRNAFAYYYVSVIPLASLACGLAVARLEGWLSRRPLAAGIVTSLSGLALWTAGWMAYRALDADTIAPQREVIDAVREAFPAPVPYLDRASMIAMYPSAGPFMTTYVLTDYRERGTANYPELVRRRQPRFLLANVDGLDLARPWDSMAASPYRLLREDFDYLKDHYVHHWGPVWVAGTTRLADAERDLVLELPVPGPYTVESPGVVILDGDPVAGGSVVQVEQGEHTLRSGDSAKAVTLRFGDRLARPVAEPPSGPLFLGLGLPGRRPVQAARQHVPTPGAP